MLPKESLLVIFLKLVERLPFPATPAQRKRGHPEEYRARLIVKPLIVRTMRRLYTASSLLVFLDRIL